MVNSKQGGVRKSVDDALMSIKDIATSSRKRSSGGKRKRRSRPRTIRQHATRFGAGLVVFLFVIVLPFFLLIRVATALYLESAVNHWLAIGGGMIAAGVVLLLYAHFVSTWIGLGALFRKGAGRMVALVVVAYCGYGLLYLSASNAKTSEVASTYTRLHPIIRLSVSTWLLIDPDALLTDTERVRSDYGAMGLPPLERSLHYRQADGYSHAVDMRTIGRSQLRNTIAAFYFRVVGLNTLRHVGTADHLHISLPVAGSAGARSAL